MKVISLASLLSVANADSFFYKTWCGPTDGQITSESACKAAAAANGGKYATTAGPEWHRGCIVNGGLTYYSEPKASGKITHTPSDGYYCKKQNSWSRSKELCAKESQLRDEQECARAAQERGFAYAGTAGPEWVPGCITNGDRTYWSDPRTNDPTRMQQVDGGYFCRVTKEAEMMEKAKEAEIMKRRFEEAEMKKKAMERKEAEERKRKFEAAEMMKKLEEEAAMKQKEEAEMERKKAEKAYLKKKELAEMLRRQEEEADMKKKAMERKEEAERKRKEYEMMKKKAEEAEMKKKEEEAERKRKEYEMMKKKAEEAEKEAEMMKKKSRRS